MTPSTEKSFLNLVIYSVKICVEYIYPGIFNVFSVLWFMKTNNPLLKI